MTAVLPDEVLWRDRLPIGGRWISPAGRDTITVINPASEKPVGACPAAGAIDIDLAVSAARAAFDTGPWPRMPMHERARHLMRVLAVYQTRLEAMAALITAQNGSPVSFTAQTSHPVGILRYYADLGSWRRLADHRGGDLHVLHEPVGVVAAIVPWNMPQKTILMKVAPALLAGCTVVVKPAPETPLDALLLADIMHEAGLPDGVFNVVPAGPVVSEDLVTHRGVDKVAFTGSTATGRRVAGLCGRTITRSSLELGGKSPAIVCADADPSAVVEALARDTFLLSGQICSAHTRLLVPAPVHDEYAAMAGKLAESLVVGDPTDPATEIGPLVARRQQKRVIDYITAAIDSDARLVTGGPTPPVDTGWYVTPTVFAGVDNRQPIAREEVFGPVLSVIAYRDEEHAIALANDSVYGLEAAVWSADRARAIAVASRLRAGTIRINGAVPPLHSPLGGFKQSGIGRELGPEGLDGYLETKAVAG